MLSSGSHGRLSPSRARPCRSESGRMQAPSGTRKMGEEARTARADRRWQACRGRSGSGSEAASNSPKCRARGGGRRERRCGCGGGRGSKDGRGCWQGAATLNVVRHGAPPASSTRLNVARRPPRRGRFGPFWSFRQRRGIDPAFRQPPRGPEVDRTWPPAAGTAVVSRDMRLVSDLRAPSRAARVPRRESFPYLRSLPVVE